MLKDLLLKKGWAGKTISRSETVERLNPIIRQLIILNHQHDAFVRGAPDDALAAELAALQKISRVDVGKLAETIFSCGGTAYSGTDLNPEDFGAADSPPAAVQTLVDLEKALLDTLAAESKVEHQMRTRAVLATLRGNSEKRFEVLGGRGR